MIFHLVLNQPKNCNKIPFCCVMSMPQKSFIVKRHTLLAQPLIDKCARTYEHMVVRNWFLVPKDAQYSETYAETSFQFLKIFSFKKMFISSFWDLKDYSTKKIVLLWLHSYSDMRMFQKILRKGKNNWPKNNILTKYFRFFLGIFFLGIFLNAFCSRHEQNWSKNLFCSKIK